jgi:hypothetical protein
MEKGGEAVLWLELADFIFQTFFAEFTGAKVKHQTGQTENEHQPAACILKPTFAGGEVRLPKARGRLNCCYGAYREE